MKKQYKTLILSQLIIIIFLLISFLFFRSGYIAVVPKCIFREKYGILCPACYGTRFAIEIAKFNFIAAFKVHPIFFISIIYLILLDSTYVVNVIFNKKIDIFKWWHAIIWLILILIYTILRNII